MVFKDDEIKKARTESQAGDNKTKRAASERKLDLRELAKKIQQAKKAKDRVSFEKLLESCDVKRGSDEWRACWEYFYSDEF
jgi:hypothetical protein